METVACKTLGVDSERLTVPVMMVNECRCADDAANGVPKQSKGGVEDFKG